MQPSRRSPWLAVLIASLAGTSVSAGETATRAIDLPIATADLPTTCEPFSRVPADSTSELLAWDQRLSLAACLQTFDVPPAATLHELPILVARLDRAVEPSLAIYRDAIQRGPDSIRLLATYGVGMTHVATMVRARRAVDNAGWFGGNTYGSARDRFTILHWSLEWLLAEKRAAALAAFREVDRIADADPALAAHDAVNANAVATSRKFARLLGGPEEREQILTSR